VQQSDVVVIGAGVAGASTAFFAAQHGLRVVVLDKTRFPRDTVCTSTINPRTLTALYQMGVMRDLLGDGLLPILGIQGYSYSGDSYRGYYEPHYPYLNFGHTIPRHRLDAAVVDRVRGLPGVTLLEDWAVTELVTDEAGRAIGVRGTHGGTPAALGAGLVVDAAGRGSVIARRLGLFQPMTDHERYAVVCQFAGLVVPAPLFSIGTDASIGPGYFCAFPITTELGIVAFIVDPRVWGQVRADPGHWVDAFVRRPEWCWHDWLARAERVTEVVSFGPLAYATSAVALNGVLMVGDTTGFFDPLTGEGIGLAIHSGQLAAEAAARLLGGAADWAAEHQRYAEAILAEKEASLYQLRQMHRMLQRPAAYDRFVQALSRNQEAANWTARSFANMVPPDERAPERLFELVTGARGVGEGVPA
jgi:flavin-dependent dehydrogenase